MKIECTPGLGEMRPAIRRFVTDRLDPLTRRIDATGEVPEQAMEEMRVIVLLDVDLEVTNLG